MYNKIILVGNLTKDPELRYSPQGTAITSFRIAVNSRTKHGEEVREETLFIDVVVFGKQAESCGEYLNKGRGVLVEGRLQERRWESEGQHRSKFEVIAQTVRFLPRRSAAGQTDNFEKVSNQADTDTPDVTTDLEPF